MQNNDRQFDRFRMPVDERWQGLLCIAIALALAASSIYVYLREDALAVGRIAVATGLAIVGAMRLYYYFDDRPVTGQNEEQELRIVDDDQSGLENPVGLLEDFMRQQPAQLEHPLSVARLPDPCTVEQTDGFEQEYNDLFDSVVRRIESQWGEPVFFGDWRSASFPDWIDADRLACWQRGNSTAYVSYCFDPGDSQLVLLLGTRR